MWSTCYARSLLQYLVPAFRYVLAGGTVLIAIRRSAGLSCLGMWGLVSLQCSICLTQVLCLTCHQNSKKRGTTMPTPWQSGQFSVMLVTGQLQAHTYFIYLCNIHFLGPFIALSHVKWQKQGQLIGSLKKLGSAIPLYNIYGLQIETISCL